MLARERRLTRAAEFTTVLRLGRRAGRPRLIVHALRDVADPRDTEMRAVRGRSSRLGLIVSKKVGDAVTRHRVSRRLRHVSANALSELDDGTDVVVRALPPAAAASSAQLAAELRAALEQALRTRGSEHPGRRGGR